ncbi:hypothetical protein ACOME3_004746 [Neoechinorhynchus agilis]
MTDKIEWTIDRSIRTISSSSESSDDSFIRNLLDKSRSVVKDEKLIKKQFEIIEEQNSYVVEDLPPIEDITLFVDPTHDRLERLGTIVSTVDQIVTIQSEPIALHTQVNVPGRGAMKINTVDEGTVVFDKFGSSVGRVNDVIGPIVRPYYTMKAITEIKMSIGQEVFYLPNDRDLTVYLLSEAVRNRDINVEKVAAVSNVPELLEITKKGCDASWRNDEEMPADKAEFSDDEAERSHKKANKRKQTKKLKVDNPVVNQDDVYRPQMNPSYREQWDPRIRGPFLVPQQPPMVHQYPQYMVNTSWNMYPGIWNQRPPYYPGGYDYQNRHPMHWRPRR